MILIIDGLPRTGKTTLAEHFRGDLSLQFGSVEVYNSLEVFEEWDMRIAEYIYLSQEEGVHMIFDGGLMLARFHDPRSDFSRLDAILTNADAFLIYLTESPITIHHRLMGAEQNKKHRYNRNEIIEGHQRCLGEFRASQIETKGSFLATQFLIKIDEVPDMFVKTDHYQYILKAIKEKWEK